MNVAGEGDIAYEAEGGRMASAFIVAPRSVATEVQFTVTVQIHADGTGVEARLRARYPGFVVTASRVPFHDRIKAVLGGMLPHDATTRSPPVQRLREGGFVDWAWQVTARQPAGPADPPIEVRLYAVVREEDNGDQDSPIDPPLLANVDVAVPATRVVSDFAKTWGPVLGFGTALAAAIGGALAWLRKRAAPRTKARAKPKKKPAAAPA